MEICGSEIGQGAPLVVIAGPCVVESEALALETAGYLVELTRRLGIPFIYKSSFDKANRTSLHSFRGLGIDKGLAILEQVKKHFQVPILTDVHEDTPLDEVASVVDVLQTPAFLCRQTNFIQNVAKTGLPVNIKKGQFLAPWDMEHVLIKAQATGNRRIMACERGVSFGYNNLVVDMRSLAIMKKFAAPVIFDATHSVQQPGGQGHASGGQREFITTLARSAVAVGIDGIYLETHPQPDKALSDGPNSLPMAAMPQLLETLMSLDNLIKERSHTYAEDNFSLCP